MPPVITIVKGVGVGPTTLAAFDAALRRAEIANFNLIPLSSVIPTGSPPIEIGAWRDQGSAGWGDRLYVVLAEERVQERNLEAWAGLGWVQESASGRGLFVEHHGNSEATVRADIEATLSSMVDGRDGEFGEIQMEVVGAVCDGEPTCVLVAAVYTSESW